MEEPIRDREISYELSPQTFIENSRDIRQVSPGEWALACHARAQSHRLQARARALRRTSQVLMERHQRWAQSSAHPSPKCTYSVR